MFLMGKERCRVPIGINWTRKHRMASVPPEQDNGEQDNEEMDASLSPTASTSTPTEQGNREMEVVGPSALDPDSAVLWSVELVLRTAMRHDEG